MKLAKLYPEHLHIFICKYLPSQYEHRFQRKELAALLLRDK